MRYEDIFLSSSDGDIHDIRGPSSVGYLRPSGSSQFIDAALHSPGSQLRVPCHLNEVSLRKNRKLPWLLVQDVK